MNTVCKSYKNGLSSFFLEFIKSGESFFTVPNHLRFTKWYKYHACFSDSRSKTLGGGNTYVWQILTDELNIFYRVCITLDGERHFVTRGEHSYPGFPIYESVQ